MAKKTANLQLDPAVLTELSTGITQQVLQAIEEREASRQEQRDVPTQSTHEREKTSLNKMALVLAFVLYKQSYKELPRV